MSFDDNFFYAFYFSWPLSCEKIQRITIMLTLGQIKLYMGPVNKNPKKKIQKSQVSKIKNL